MTTYDSDPFTHTLSGTFINRTEKVLNDMIMTDNSFVSSNHLQVARLEFCTQMQQCNFRGR